MLRLAALHSETTRADRTPAQRWTARYRFAEHLSRNPERLYFNDLAWTGYQSYALRAAEDFRLTRAERERLVAVERSLRDGQEERWRAWKELRAVTFESGDPDLGRRAARLALDCLSRISARFGREDEIRAAGAELAGWLRRVRVPDSQPR